MNTRDAVLAVLKKNSNVFVSGEQISRALSITRAAVNIAVKSIKNDGYEIASSTNKGYKLVSSPNIITCGELAPLLPADRTDRIICLKEVESTNSYLKALALDGAPEGQIAIADSQTKGRGRLGRRFASPPNTGLYLSALMRPADIAADSIANITAWVAVAVSDAIERVCGVRPDIKWINDLILNKKKICGILTETAIESESGHVQYVIVGIGINLNSEAKDFDGDLKQIATSLYNETGKKYDRPELAAEIIKALDSLPFSDTESKSRYLSAYKKHCISLGKNVRIVAGNKEYFGYALDIDDDFRLKVRLDDGTVKHVSSGEVSVRGIYDYV